MERKVKYYYAFKLEYIKLIIEKHYTRKDESNEKGINEFIIYKWLKFYNSYGKKGLLPRKINIIQPNLN